MPSISVSDLKDLADLYDEYFLGDPQAASTRQARVLYEAIAKRYLQKEPDKIREMLLSRYIASCITPEVERYLDARQSQYPTIQPEQP